MENDPSKFIDDLRGIYHDYYDLPIKDGDLAQLS
jgi:hypothetical protein